MAHAQINTTPFSGSETDNFNEFEQLITGAIGVAAIAAAQQANFLQLHLKGDALRYFLTLPEATRLVFADNITALRNRFTQDDLREIRIIKLENQKFNPKTDTVKNFLVKLRTEANKAYPAPEIVVAPAGAGDPEARRFERETAARDSALQMSENRKNEQIKRFFIKSMPNWLKPKLLERPETDTIDQLCTLASQQIAIREMCNREEYFDDGFNEITESNTDKMLKAITVISNNQKELEQKLEQRTAAKNEPPEQGPVNIFTPHYPQQVYRQRLIDKISAGNIKIINQIIVNISPIIVNFSKTIGPSMSMPPVLIITENLDHNLMPLDHFIIMNSHKLGIIGLNFQIAPHLFIQPMLID